MTNSGEMHVLQQMIQSVETNQRESRELYMSSFKRLADKLDILPQMRIELATVSERLSNHIERDDEIQTPIIRDIENLKKESWKRHGFAGAIGAIAALIAGFLHK